MAAVKTKVDTRIVLGLDTGESKNGAAVKRSYTFSKVKLDATDDQLLAAGNALASLRKESLDSVKVNEVYDLVAGA